MWLLGLQIFSQREEQRGASTALITQHRNQREDEEPQSQQKVSHIKYTNGSFGMHLSNVPKPNTYLFLTVPEGNI